MSWTCKILSRYSRNKDNIRKKEQYQAHFFFFHSPLYSSGVLENSLTVMVHTKTTKLRLLDEMAAKIKMEKGKKEIRNKEKKSRNFNS